VLLQHERGTYAQMPEAAIAVKPTNPSVAADDAVWERAMDLPCQLAVDVPLPQFKISDWLRLQRESVIDSHCPVSADVPLRANGVLIAWTEFEVVGDRLAVRVTELA
jgi:flagellar motor switch/type III secretory pathway protein FliN